MVPTGERSGRVAAVDAARGVAIGAMAAYHLVWDLTYLGFLTLPLFEHPLWLAARTAILGSFLALVGVGLVLGERDGIDRRRVLRRLWVLVLAAAGVSALSFALFPASPIFFGVLHHIAVASVLGLLALRLPGWLVLALGVAVFAAGDGLGHPAFDSPWLRWIGFTTMPPESNDYVPLFPWFGIVLGGIAAARMWLDAAPAPSWTPEGRGPRALVWAGRRSLAIYLIHQPVLFGTLWLAAMVLPPQDPDLRDFMGSCTATCRDAGRSWSACEAGCRCVADRFQAEGLWRRALDGALGPADSDGIARVYRSCL